jgi:YHS domain-containing protein
MRTHVLALAAAALLGGLTLAASHSAIAAPSTQPTTAPSKPINTHCPINRDEEVDPKVTYVYNGKTIAFCCESCIPKFKKDPEKYLAGLK